jgi:hypothetical protein
MLLPQMISERKEWSSPRIESRTGGDRELAEFLVGWLEVPLSSLRERWAAIRSDLRAAPSGEQREWLELLLWLHQSLEAKLLGRGADCSFLLDWVQARWPSREMELMRALLRLHLLPFEQAFPVGPTIRGVTELTEVLEAVLRPRPSFDPKALAPFVRYALGRSDHGISRRAESLVAFSGAPDYLLDWIEQAKESEPSSAIQAARNLWRLLAQHGPIDARRLWAGVGPGGPIAAWEAGLENLRDSPHPEVAFFATCTLRLRHGAGSRALPRPARLPDIELEIRHWPGPETTLTCRAPRHHAMARHLQEQVHQPSRLPCWVCACQHTTLIYSERESDLTFKWSLDEVCCDDCGAYSLYLTDD